MHVALAEVSLSLIGHHERGARRKALRSLMDRVRARHRVSIADLNPDAAPEAPRLGVAICASDAREAERMLGEVLRTIEGAHVGLVTRVEREIFLWGKEEEVELAALWAQRSQTK